MLTIRHNECHEALATADAILLLQIIGCGHHTLTHARMSTNGGLDLTRLDAEASDLDLLIGAPDDLNNAVGAITRQVAGSVEPLAALPAKRIRHEALRRLLRLVDVAAADAAAADIQFAADADRNQAARAVQHIGLRVGDRPADRDDRRPVAPDRNGVRHHDPARFRLTEHVDEGRSGPAQAPPSLDQRRRQRLARGKHQPHVIVEQAGAGRRFERHQNLKAARQEGGDEIEDRNVLMADRLEQGLRIAKLLRRRNRDGGAARKGHRELPHRRGKRERCGVQIAIVTMNSQGLRKRLRVVTDIAMRDHHAFRLARGARGVDHVSQRIGRGRSFEIARAFTCDPRLDRIDADDFRQTAWIGSQGLNRGSDFGQEGRLRDKERYAGIAQLERNAAGRIVRVERQKRATRLPYAKQHC